MTKASSGESLRVQSRTDVSSERQMAEVAADPAVTAGLLTAKFSKSTFGDTDLTELIGVVRDASAKAKSGDLGGLEAMLASQAVALNAMFCELARRGALNMGDYIQAAESYVRMALKAQAQCRSTIETLANIKNPPVVYARQANIANGPQQVNNGVAAPRAIKPASPPNEQLETEHGKRLEPGATGAAIGSDTALEAVGAIDRAADGEREGKRQPQRRQGREAASAPG